MPPRFWWGLAAVSAVVLVVQLPGPHATAWHFFELAVDLLRDAGPSGDRSGLRLYGDHPELQFGPVNLLAAAPFTLLGSDVGEIAVMVAGSVLGLVTVRLVLTAMSVPAVDDGAAVDARAWVTGVVLVVVWGDIAVRTAHIDDAIALASVGAALVALGRRRPGWTTLFLALAAAAKPWAVVFAPLAALPITAGSRRRPFVAAGAAVATWVPFILAEPDTLDTSRFEIVNDPTSSLRALGIDAATTPSWVRPAQLLAGLAIVALLVARDRWPGAILAGISWRLLLDPGVHRYYTAGFVIGALLVEDRLRPGRPPWCTVAAALVLEVTAVPDIPVWPARVARLGVIVLALAATTRAVAPRPAPIGSTSPEPEAA